MARNLVGYFCKGEGKRFGGTLCGYFTHVTTECTLLKEFELHEVFEKGRCEPFEMLRRAIQKHLEKYRDVVDPGEYIESMAFEISERLKSKFTPLIFLSDLSFILNKNRLKSEDSHSNMIYSNRAFNYPPHQLFTAIAQLLYLAVPPHP